MRKLLIIFGLACGLFSFANAATVENEGPVALKISESLTLHDCSPVTLIPCFTMGVVPVGADGNPAGVFLPPVEHLRESVSLISSSGTITPFYVKAAEGRNASARPHIVLVEVDISGSMDEQTVQGVSRFVAARQVIANYLSMMQEGIDEVAIVPFESHHVVPTIQSAVFTANKNQAIAELDGLSEPTAKNNTALYQAVFTGVSTLENEVDRLEKKGISRANLIPQLIVMTDGKNEVLRGDDEGLLDGQLGLQQASEKAQASGFDVIGIGFGDPAVIDADALKRLSTHFFLATDPVQLLQAFRSSTKPPASSLAIGFLAPGNDRASLAAGNFMVRVALKLPDGRTLQSPTTQYIAPAIGMPLYEGKVSYDELAALSSVQPPAISGWSSVLRSILVIVGLGLLLLLLWFWVPRLVWRGEYDLSRAADGRQRRWGKGIQASGVQVRDNPDGFENVEGAATRERTASQITQVKVRTEDSDNQHPTPEVKVGRAERNR